MSQQPPLLIDVFQELVQKTSQKVYGSPDVIDFQPGRPTQILTEVQKITNAIKTETRGKRYPLFALFYDFPQDKGGGYPTSVTIPKISIACLTNMTDPVLARYPKTFKPILYPIYEEFLRQLTRHKNIVGNDPAAFPHKLWERPGSQPEGQTLNDYLDALEIMNLQLTIKTVNSCKTLNS